MVNVRPLRGDDIATSSRIHHEVLDAEFLARCGEAFLRCYQRAWVESPDGIALAAIDESGRVVGALLGAMRPERHFRAMVLRHGPALAFLLLAHAVRHPRFARELVATRTLRYGRGLLRILGSSGQRRDRHPAPRMPVPATDATSTELDATAQPRVGEVTHLMVRADARGGGVGRALLLEARRAAQSADLDELVLVTPPDLAARGFYEHLGWQPCGALTSRSGEQFFRYNWPLRP